MILHGWVTGLAFQGCTDVRCLLNKDLPITVQPYRIPLKTCISSTHFQHDRGRQKYNVCDTFQGIRITGDKDTSEEDLARVNNRLSWVQLNHLYGEEVVLQT